MQFLCLKAPAGSYFVQKNAKIYDKESKAWTSKKHNLKIHDISIAKPYIYMITIYESKASSKKNMENYRCNTPLTMSSELS